MKNIQDPINNDLQYAASISDVMAPRVRKSNRIMESSFHRIPAVKSFVVKPGRDNTVLNNTGLERKLPSMKSHETHEGNNKMNRYMEFKILSMKKALAAGKPEIYWAMALKEMKNSTAFRTSAFNTVAKGWYKQYPKGEILRTLVAIEKILSQNEQDLKYFRVEIPKGSLEDIKKFYENNPKGTWPGKTRPLGVPTLAWRVVLHLWNGFLTIFLEEELKRFNHAYMPGVGTNTAIKDWIQKVLPSPYVYEFDIKGFFNNVSLSNTNRLLEERGMPTRPRELIYSILKNAPKNMSIWENQSTDYDRSLVARNFYKSTGTLTPHEWIANLKGIFRNPKPALREKLALQWVTEIILDGQGRKDFDFSLPLWDNGLSPLDALLQESSATDKGLPQGAAPSTILALLALAEWHKELEKKDIKLLMYADDGFLYSNQAFEPFPPEGFEFAENKSRWLKRVEEEVQETKFLGVTYTFFTELLKGTTRSGKTLEFGPKQLELLKFIQDLSDYGDLMKTLVSSGIWGLTLSKLYGGKFGELEHESQARYEERSFWRQAFGPWNLKRLSEDKGLQRVASTISCEWLIGAMARSKDPNQVSRRKLREIEESWKRTADLKLKLDDLRAALAWDDFWKSRNLSLVPLFTGPEFIKPAAYGTHPESKHRVNLLKKALPFYGIVRRKDPWNKVTRQERTFQKIRNKIRNISLSK